MSIAYSNKKNDDFGSVYLCCMNALATARRDKQVYYHTHFDDLPGTTLHHNYYNDKSFSRKMNDFTGLKTDLSYKTTMEIDYRNSDKGGACGGVQGGFRVNDPNMFYTDVVLNELRESYYSTEKPTPITCDVAVHIRRGDIAGKCKKTKTFGSERCIPLKYFIEVLREIDPKKEKRIAIFSEGEESDFDEINDHNVDLYINHDLRTTFHSMVCAPILLTSPSMMSVCCALLNKNTIYYTKWGGFGVMSRWIPKDHKTGGT